MYMFMCVYIYICICICTHTLIHVRVHVSVYVSPVFSVFVRLQACARNTCVCTCVWLSDILLACFFVCVCAACGCECVCDGVQVRCSSICSACV